MLAMWFPVRYQPVSGRIPPDSIFIQLFMALTSWANASLFNLLVVLATVTHLLLPNVLLPVPDVRLTACRSLAFQERPVGRSVIPLPSSGLSDLTTCYLDTENNIIFGPLHVVFSSHSGNASVSPGQHQALLRFNTLCSVLVHLPEQPRAWRTYIPLFRPFLSCPQPFLLSLLATLFIWTMVTMRRMDLFQGGHVVLSLRILYWLFTIGGNHHIPWHFTNFSLDNDLHGFWI